MRGMIVLSAMRRSRTPLTRSSASTMDSDVLRAFLDDVAVGEAVVPIGRVFALDEIREAHRVMEDNTAGGKIVVVTDGSGWTARL